MRKRGPSQKDLVASSAGSSRLPPIYGSEEFVAGIVKMSKDEGVGFSEFGRSAFLQYSQQSGPTNENEIRFELSPDDMSELQELADATYYEDVNAFVKTLARAAMDAGPDAIRQLLFGRLEEISEEKRRQEEKSTSGNATRAKRIRDAA